MTGNLAEMMTDYDKAMSCYESALRHNPYSVVALSQIASLCRGREQFGRAVDYFKRILAIQENNGETWAALGHCYLMMDNLQEAYQAYQQALYHLSNPKVSRIREKGGGGVCVCERERETKSTISLTLYFSGS